MTLGALAFGSVPPAEFAASGKELEGQRDQHVDTAASDRLRPLIDRFRARRCPAT
jgi:hypothetical protein